MATVNIQENPFIVIAGTKNGDCTIISSGWPATAYRTRYEIVKRSTGESIILDTRNAAMLTNGNIQSITSAQLRIILESRTTYRVRTQWAENVSTQMSNWSGWTTFKTRDKRYQSPDAITQLTDDTNLTAATIGARNRTINVTNNGKVTLETTGTGVTVTNIDTTYVGTQLQNTGDKDGVVVNKPVNPTVRGATVINVPAGQNRRIVYTNTGATVTAE